MLVAESAEAVSFTSPYPLMSISISLSSLTSMAPQRLLKLWPWLSAAASDDWGRRPIPIPIPCGEIRRQRDQ